MIFSEDASVVRLAGCISDSSVDGPGIRYVLFFQGCFHNCEGCHNPTTHSWTANESSTDTSVDMILNDFHETAVAKRVTISGGEPFGQPYALKALLKAFNREGVADIWVYTGYTLEELLGNDLFVEILELCAVVVTGRFDITKTTDSMLFTGSSNQEVYMLFTS